MIKQDILLGIYNRIVKDAKQEFEKENYQTSAIYWSKAHEIIHFTNEKEPIIPEEIDHDWVRKMRIIRRLTTKEVSELTGIEYGHITNIETKKYGSLHIETKNKLFEAFQKFPQSHIGMELKFLRLESEISLGALSNATGIATDIITKIEEEDLDFLKRGRGHATGKINRERVKNIYETIMKLKKEQRSEEKKYWF